MTYKNNYNSNRRYVKNDDRPRDGGLEVTVRNGDVEKALRLFKKKVQKSGILKELKAKQYYEKPAEAKQRKKKEAVKRWRKLQKKLEENM